MNILEVKNLSLKFKNHTTEVLQDISFTIKRGECAGIVGESANGKTTLILAILNLINPKILSYKKADKIVLGTNIDLSVRYNLERTLGKQISIIFQDSINSLHPLMRVGDGVAKIIKKKRRCSSSSAKSTVLQIFKILGFNNPLEIYYKYPYELSGGMRQRIVWAMSLAINPELIIADEPFSFLDIENTLNLIKLIKKLKTETKISFLIISHDISVLYNICDRIYVIHAGQVVEQGTPEEIFFSPKIDITKQMIKAAQTLDFMD